MRVPFYNKSSKSKFNFIGQFHNFLLMLSVKQFTVFVSLIFLLIPACFSQQVPIGQWRDELPYNEVISVTEAGSRIYCATPYAVFYYDKEDNTVIRMTKINGLSDIGISTINYSTASKTLVIAYVNANIDLVKNNTIINISDIKRKSILGNKTINRINFIGPYTYLSCGFGIVVLDIEKEEIHDTYYIGHGGDHVNVFGLVKTSDDTLFAATEKGIYKAYYNSPNLVDFASWHKDPGIDSNSRYNAITFFAGEVVVAKANTLLPSNIGSDTLYRFSSSRWTRWSLDTYHPVMNLESTYQYLCISYDYYVNLYDTLFNFHVSIFNYGEGIPPNSLDAITDKDNALWIGDRYMGTIRHPLETFEYNFINLSGPLTANAFSMTAGGNDLYITRGGMNSDFSPPYYPAQIYHFDTENWINLSGSNTPVLNTVNDIVTIAVDPSDRKHMFAGSYNGGLLEFYDGVFQRKYKESNSTLHHHILSDTSDVRVGGVAFDKNGDLWAVTSHNDSCLSKKHGDQWTGYSVPENNNSDLGMLMIDRNNQKWILMRFQNSNSNSVLVVSENGDQAVTLNSSAGHGNIPGSNVFAIAEDLNGEVWVGTESGIGVFYSPENIFVPGENYDAQQILVQQGTYTQYLLENETVTAIAVDGGNNKWIGTDRGGLYQFSPDGTKQLNHFTEEDSPLFSDRITSIAITQTGEVFVGTDKGVISYRGTATPAENSDNVYAFPNPVKHDYSGLIAITGLTGNATVKITDINGTLVYATTAEGGQAIWDGKNFNGNKAQTGVYLVFASSSSGSDKVVTKILIIN
jgi:hypothetical protein